MAIEKRENILLSLAIQATPILNDKAEVEYVINTTLQTGTAHVDTETNNFIGSVIPNPAYQQPDAVVQQYLGEAMASLTSAVGQEQAKNKAQEASHKTAIEQLTADKDAAFQAAANAAAATLKAAQDSAKATLEATQAEHTKALADQKQASDTQIAELKATIEARDATITAKQAEIEAKVKEHGEALKAKDKLIGDKDAWIAKLDTLLDGTEAGRAELKRREDEAKANAAAEAIANALDANLDIDALVQTVRKQKDAEAAKAAVETAAEHIGG